MADYRRLVLITDQLDLTGTHEIESLCSSIVSPGNTRLIDLRPVTFILCNKSDLAAPRIIVLDVLVNIGQVFIRLFVIRLPFVTIVDPVAGCRCLKCTVLHNERFQIGAVAEYDIAHGDELFRKGDGFQTPTRGEGSAVQFCECRGELNAFQVCKAPQKS